MEGYIRRAASPWLVSRQISARNFRINPDPLLPELYNGPFVATVGSEELERAYPSFFLLPCAGYSLRLFSFATVWLGMSTEDWGQDLPLGTGIADPSRRPFQRRLTFALAQALKTGPDKVKWDAVVKWFEAKANGKEPAPVDTGMGEILSKSIYLDMSGASPYWLCHCCQEKKVQATENADATHLIPCHSLQNFLPQGKVMTPSQAELWLQVKEKVASLGPQLLLATPKFCILCCKSCNQDIEKRDFFAKKPADDGKWHRFNASGFDFGPVGDTLAMQFDGDGGIPRNGGGARHPP